MFLPIGDAPNPKGTPFVTYALVAANVAAYLFLNLPLGARHADVSDPAFAEYVDVVSRQLGGQVPVSQIVRQTSAYDLFAFEHGYRPAAPQVVDLFTCMFLHGGFMHLFGNMLFLWIYGDNVERRLGALGYLFWYLATGVAATLVFGLVFSPGSDMPLVGASGAISGVLGFYFVWFPRNVVRVLIFLPPFFLNVFEIPARIVLGVFLVFDNLLPVLFAGDSGVAHGAHIGGFVVGSAVAWLLDRRSFEAPPRRLEPVAAPGGQGGVRQALAEGRLADAARAYFALPADATRGALSPEEAVSLASWLRDQGHSDAALVILRRIVRDTPRAPGLGDVYALAGLILLNDRREPTAAYQYLLTALDLHPRPETAALVRQGLAAIEELQKRRVGQLRRPSW
jgi:rhomboid family protein